MRVFHLDVDGDMIHLASEMDMDEWMDIFSNDTHFTIYTISKE